MLTVLASTPTVLHDALAHVGAVVHQVAATAPDGSAAVDPSTVTTTVTVDAPAPDDDSAIDLDINDPSAVAAVFVGILVVLVRGDFISPSPGFWVFLGILGAFLVTRAITRFIRRRGASGTAATGPVKDIVIGGVHIHHQVFGIALMFLTGLIAIITTADDDWPQAPLALAFGVGVGLAFDEFALWLHLDDVYWSRKGRKSIDAVVVVLVITASSRAVIDVVRTVKALEEDSVTAIWALPIIVLIVVPAVVCMLKGKWITAAIGFLYPPVAWIGSVRLAKERSWWGRHLFGPRRRARARTRHEGHEQRMERLRDLVGGAISPVLDGSGSGSGVRDEAPESPGDRP